MSSCRGRRRAGVASGQETLRKKADLGIGRRAMMRRRRDDGGRMRGGGEERNLTNSQMCSL